MRRVGLLLIALALPIQACATEPTTSAANDLTVFAASSLEPVLGSLETELEDELQLELHLSFSSSTTAARQVVEGAPADVLITADESTMQIASRAEVVERPRLLARNRLALIVELGNPKGIEGLADLERSELSIVLCDPEVPCGRLARLLLADVGIDPVPDSSEENASAAVGRVALGEADATIGYVTDVKLRADRLEQIAGSDTENDEFAARYLAAVVRDSPARSAARRLIEHLRSAAVQDRLAESGFEVGQP